MNRRHMWMYPQLFGAFLDVAEAELLVIESGGG